MTLTQVKTQMNSILKAPRTWWDLQTLQDRLASVDESVSRQIDVATAWNMAGVVQAYWNDTVKFIVNEIHQKNSREINKINKGIDWRGPIDCFMVGMTVEQATPTVVLTGLDVRVLKRMRTKLVENHCFRQTGFKIRGNYGLLKYCNDDTAPQTKEQTLLEAKVDFFGRSLCSLESSGVRQFATIGAVIKISEKHFALTAAHVFESNTDGTVPTDTRPEATYAGEILDDEFFDSFDDEGYDEPSSSPNDQDQTRNYSECQFSRRVRFEPKSTSRTVVSENEPVIKSTAAICHPEDEHTDNTTTLFMNRSLDWALIDLENWTGYEPLNFLVKDGKSLSTINCAENHPQGEVMIVSQACMYPIARCSGTQALVRMPGCDSFQSVFTLESLPSEQQPISNRVSGQSGALVIDNVSGEAYGMLAAQCTSLNMQYMIPLRQIFQDISHYFRDERVVLPTSESEMAVKTHGDMVKMLPLISRRAGRTTPLHVAATVGDAVAVKAHVRAGADLTAHDGRGMVPLHVAAGNGYAEAVQILIAAGAPGEIPDNLGQTALILAAGQWLARDSSDSASDWHRNSLQTVDLLLRNGAKVNVQDGHYYTALYMASKVNQAQIVELLLQHGADTNIRCSPFRETALHAASNAGHTQIVGPLLQHDADINRYRYNHASGVTALYVASSAGHAQIVELLLQYGANVDIQCDYDRTALCAASVAGHTQVVKLLLQQGANVNTENGYSGGIALHAASKAGHKQIVELLLQHGADVKIKDNFDSTALHAASEAGHLQAVALLLQYGADVNMHSRTSHNTALYAASVAGHTQVVKLLLQQGANINTGKDYLGETALHAASKAGHALVVELLLQYGADVNWRNRFHDTALYAASYAGHAQVVELLLQYGADVNWRDHSDTTALYVASDFGHAQVVELLLQQGANINTGNGYFSETALHAASKAGHTEIVDLLLQHGGLDHSPKFSDDQSKGQGPFDSRDISPDRIAGKRAKSPMGLSLNLSAPSVNDDSQELTNAET